MDNEIQETASGRPMVLPSVPQILTRDWGDEIIFAQTDRYLGKILKMRAGTKGGLQVHAHKDETFLLLQGTAIVRSESADGGLMERTITGGTQLAFRIHPGAVHQVEAVTECLLVEASTSHYNDRIRMEGVFGLPEGGGLPTTS